MNTLPCGVTRAEFWKVAHDFTQKNAVPHFFLNIGATWDEFVAFVRRHPGIIPTSLEPTSIIRTRGSVPPQIACF
jgi:hypothetical protein